VTAAGPRGARQVPFAVSGATGALGGRVAARLADLGHGQRLIVRDKNRAPDLPGAEAAEASYEDPGAMRQALAGARTFFMVSASETHDRVRQHIAAVDAAVAAGVERIVYLSFLGAGPQATFTFARHHWWTEEHVRATGLRHTFLRDSLYLDLLPVFTGTDGVIRGPAGDGRVAAVARDDIADVAVVQQDRDGHDGRTYDVTGPRRSRCTRWPRSSPGSPVAPSPTTQRRSKRRTRRAPPTARPSGRFRAGSPPTSPSPPES
jgi:NAD(P)H dehydrogenase (quinone)